MCVCVCMRACVRGTRCVYVSARACPCARELALKQSEHSINNKYLDVNNFSLYPFQHFHFSDHYDEVRRLRHTTFVNHKAREKNNNKNKDCCAARWRPIVTCYSRSAAALRHTLCSTHWRITSGAGRTELIRNRLLERVFALHPRQTKENRHAMRRRWWALQQQYRVCLRCPSVRYIAMVQFLYPVL